MGRYALQRLLLVIPTLLGMTLLIFILVRLLPGDVVTSMSAGDITSDANHQRIRQALGLNDPLRSTPRGIVTQADRVVKEEMHPHPGVALHCRAGCCSIQGADCSLKR